MYKEKAKQEIQDILKMIIEYDHPEIPRIKCLKLDTSPCYVKFKLERALTAIDDITAEVKVVQTQIMNPLCIPTIKVEVEIK